MIVYSTAIVVICLMLLIGAAWRWGPRTVVDTNIDFDPGKIGDNPESYLAQAEAKIAGIKPKQHKEIVWADPAIKGRTPLSIVYIHGFSASPAEMRPVPDIVAKELGANLYIARLYGHGTTTDAMVGMSVKSWVMDLAEAMAIGERLGDKVVVMAASTGASLATWGMMQPAYRDLVAAAVLISPNYGIRAFGASLLTIPFARHLAHLLMGRTRSFEPDNELQRLYWTTTYPVDALLPMAETVRLAINAPVEKTAIPALFLISPEDMVVDPDKTRAIARRWGAAYALMEVKGVEDPARHVLGGDAMSPGTTATVARLATRWLGEVVPEAERHILEKAFLTPTQSADI